MVPLVPQAPLDDQLSTDDLGSRIVGLAGRLAAATCGWLLLVAEFDRRDGCARWGLATTAAWLMHTCALSRRTAFEHVRVARALAAHPSLVADMASGRLSYSQVRAITRAVGPDDAATVADLVQASQHCSIGQLETVVRGLRACERNDEVDSAEDDYLKTGWTPESRWRMHARLSPEDGALVESVISTVARADGLTRAEALVRIAEIALAAVNDSTNPPRPLRGDEHAAIVVHIDAADIPATPGGSKPPDEAEAPDRSTAASSSRQQEPAVRAGAAAGRLMNGPGLRWPVIERLLCQGRLRAAVKDTDGNIQHLGRSHRTVPLRLFRALQHRDDGECGYPGCTSRAQLQAHHVEHWLWGGRTELGNLLLLCQRHHGAHHEGDFAIQPARNGRFRFVRADGVDLSLPARRDVLAATGTDGIPPLVNEVHVGAEAVTPRWDGARMDRAFVISCFAEARTRERARARDDARSTLAG